MPNCARIAKRFRVTTFVAERDEWDRWFAARREQAAALGATMANAASEIDDRAFSLFGLDSVDRHAVVAAVDGRAA